MTHLFQGIHPLVLTLLMTTVGVTADFFIKKAAGGAGVWLLGLGAALYAASAVGWCEVMATTALATVAIWYSVMIILLLAGLGWAVFHEPVSLKQLIGMGCAVAAIILTA